VSVNAGHSLSASSDTGLHQALQTTDGEAKLHLQVQANVQVGVMAGGGGGDDQSPASTWDIFVFSLGPPSNPHPSPGMRKWERKRSPSR